MSNYHPWKALERRTAKNLRGIRLWRPDYSDSDPDGESGTHTWDCKVRQSIAPIGWFVKCEKKYREHTKDRRFVMPLFSTKHRSAGDFVLVRMKDYAEDQRLLDKLRKEVDGI